MKASIQAFGAGLLRLRRSLLTQLRGSDLKHSYTGADAPLRAELFSADQMERHGKSLATFHKLDQQHGPDQLLERLANNENVLIDACNLLRAAVKTNQRITPAGEWLLDNFYLVEEQIRTARRHFPKGYSRELPLLANGPSMGLPRVYDIALEAIAHGDGRVDPESLDRFVAAYQKVGDLKLGELWAIPIMLRLALIENLRRVSARIAAGMIARNQAGAWANQMIDIAETDPKNLIVVTADMARSNPELVSSFVAELARRLQGQSTALALPLTWVAQRLSESGSTIEQLVQSENRSQAANQVSISNSIGSLRFLGAMDWREFVETMSAVEQKLREDPNGVYARMDFATRDRYRHVIEQIARRGGLSENDVARKAIQLAHEGKAATGGGDERAAHVGYYLVDRGRQILEHALGLQGSATTIIKQLGNRYPLPLYLICIAVVTAVVTINFLKLAAPIQPPNWMLALLVIAALLSASQLALTLVNWLATLLVTPDLLPRMDYAKGIAAEARTLVVVPTLLGSLQGVDDLVEALEVSYLANRDARLHFGLLTDFCDADEETMPGDDALLQHATGRIGALNVKYDSSETFFLFHRPRRWNGGERVWMGYERKRGKLAELNALLREGTTQPFSQIVGATAVLKQVKYVITLDTDTQMPRDSARQFAATMAHPLNRPRYDEGQQRVVAGYSILQPRIAVNLVSTNRSRYAHLCGSETGIDPYTRAVSDVYQDVFHEGSFIGKGIYDVDAFERSLKNRFPENLILSHDLLEGCYARCGLISDVQLYEDYPSRYSTDVSRRHRWIRGDWQIAAWLQRRVPGVGREHRKNPLTMLSQWKIFDNLRRSLVPATLTLLLLFGWSTVPGALHWTLFIIDIMFLPPLLTSSLELLNKPRDISLILHFSTTLRAAGRKFAQTVVTLACLPYESCSNLDAIFRTSARLLVTHRSLLEWNSSGEVERIAVKGGAADLIQTYATMWIAPALAVITACAIVLLRADVFFIALPVLGVWLSAPALVWWLSRPLTRRRVRLQPGQNMFLRKLARKTWRYFETFVTDKDHWLPPDNFQEHPVAVIAHRTSPTNMGLALLANLAAYDFGYLPSGALIERTANALQTMIALDRWQGHFYNWYDTLTLKPLAPGYISSVDSGNLCGHLLTLRPGLIALVDQKILTSSTLEGLIDTMGVIMDVAESASPQLLQLRRDIDSAYDSRPLTVTALRDSLQKLELSSAALCSSAMRLTIDAADSAASASVELDEWITALHWQCRSALDELDFLIPWAQRPIAAAGVQQQLLNDLQVLPGFFSMPTLRELSLLDGRLSAKLGVISDQMIAPDAAQWLAELQRMVVIASQRALARIATIESLAQQAGEFASVDYSLVYDDARHLMAVGYNAELHQRDNGHYDLLASEARLASFVAIAQGKLPQESWFALGRLLTPAGGDSILLSWSGSMFEYLMPMLVMPSYENTLLDQTCLAMVKRQIAYGSSRGVPWGISESGYNTVDAALNYQYRAFGVPGLGLKRGLAEDLVIAPYASALALMVMPDAACQNLQRLAGDGMLGKYGMYEAIDYTPSRLPRGESSAVVQSFMAHHQGMTLLALGHHLLDRPMQKRFESDPQFQATVLLLQERVPVATAFHFHTPDLSDIRIASISDEMPMRIINSADTLVPEVQLLSNGRYHVMVTNAGGGYSRWNDLAVTRWREDATCDNWGTFCYLRDVASGEFWSTAHQPTLKRADTFEAIFSEGRAEFRRRDHDYETHTEIVVSPEDDIELRRFRITNRAAVRRKIEVTSYAEVVLATPAADALHPAFSNLFVQTEIVPDRQAILCTRRPRSAGEQMPWMFHLMAVHGAEVAQVSYETDRMRFIGRVRNIVAPQAMSDSAPLSGSQGSVLDPIVAIRYQIVLEADQTAVIDLVSGIGDSRDAVLGLADKYRDRHLADRVFGLAWTHSWVNLRQINATESDAQIYGRMAGSVLYCNPLLRAEANVLVRNRRGQSNLWGYAISGDLPIVLLQIGDLANMELVRQMIQAHAYWRIKGLAVDLVIWNEDHVGYRQLLQEQIMGMIAAGVEINLTDRPGGIFVRAAEQISEEDRILFQSVARIIISDRRGTLADQVNHRVSKDLRETPLPRLVPTRSGRIEAMPATASAQPDLIFSNGLGGFSADGREYVITTGVGRATPAPWVNVIANANFGTVISESGAAYTWSENAHEFRLTPWGGDPVSDSSGEAIYIRDEESGVFWSPTPLPCGTTVSSGDYVTHHGFGYSIFEHDQDGIHSELTVFVDTETAVKFSLLKIRNHSDRSRRLSATGYVEWALGDLRSKSAMHIITEIDPASGALYARNPYSGDFSNRIAFLDADGATQNANVTVSGDRSEFLGRNGTLKNPAAMSRARLSNKVGAGMDPCGAIQVPFELADGQEREIIFRLGDAGRRGTDNFANVIERLGSSDAAHKSLDKVHQYWRHTLGAVRVETPDPALNLLANGWLLYQVVASRLWARSGYYQSGGAFGFRDQLQDTMALVHAEPGLLREHLLRAASRQFSEGDVQHWWHPPTGRGVRTQCSDDYLWLPQAVCRYVMSSGDAAVLDESVYFLEGRPVNAEDDSYYDLPARSGVKASLYQHCARAILRGLRFGAHGLPLMGSGDWNDGMNLVGMQGKGESIWLGFFLYDTLIRFTALARAQNDAPFADRCRNEADQLRRNIEQHGWDGGWYRRAYFDDGTPLGSSSNPECQIDSVAQSWSVLSGAGDASRSRMAMEALDQHLVRREHALIQLLDPPFDKSTLNPGYIKGYVPGVRENGGQYTHGAIWAAMAFAALGDHQRAWELFNMINPIHHSSSAQAIATYKVEPYVVAADVYAVAPHVGRGGWTWYTGSASWMYRLILESLLGLHVEADTLRFAPCLPVDWKRFKIIYRYRETVYNIEVMPNDNESGSMRTIVDGVVQDAMSITLVDDQQDHHVAVHLNGPANGHGN